MSDIQGGAVVLGGGGLDRSIACVLLAYSVEPVQDRLKRLDVSDPVLSASCKALIAANVPRHERSGAIGFGAPILEAALTVIEVAPIRDKDAYRAKTVTTGNQDGGNGSGGGDVATGAHYLSMVRSDGDTTFWKIDSPQVLGATPLTTRNTLASTDSVALMNQRTAPNLARVFSSHESAMGYRVTNKASLDVLFDFVLVV